MQSMEDIVTEHELYLDAVRDFNDWLTSAKEELQRWSDLSGDSTSVQRKLSKVRVRILKTYHIPSLPRCLGYHRVEYRLIPNHFLKSTLIEKHT